MFTARLFYIAHETIILQQKKCIFVFKKICFCLSVCLSTTTKFNIEHIF